MLNLSRTFPKYINPRSITKLTNYKLITNILFTTSLQIVIMNRFQIVIGGWNNTRSVIRRCIHCRPKARYAHSPLNASEYRAFWVGWGGGVLRAGGGARRLEGEFLSWRDPAPIVVRYMAVSTGWGSPGHWGFNFGENNAGGRFILFLYFIRAAPIYFYFMFYFLFIDFYFCCYILYFIYLFIYLYMYRR